MSTRTITTAELARPPIGQPWTANDAFSLVANVCSVLGFVFTCIVLLQVKRIQQDYLAQARLPELQKKLRGHRSALSKLLNQSNLVTVRQEIEAEIQKCAANLKNLIPKLRQEQTKSISVLLVQTDLLLKSRSAPDREQVNEIYLGLVGIEEELDNLGEDMKWRARE